MRLRAVAPVVLPAAELERRQRRYDSLSPEGVGVEMASPSEGPDRLDGPDDVLASADCVYAEAMRTDWSRYGGVLLDCVLDPALERLEVDAAGPVVGITRLVSGYLTGLGHRIGGVARNQAIADELQRRLIDFGHRDRVEAVRVLHLSFEDVVRADAWNDALDKALVELQPSGVDSVINGCSAVEVRPEAGPAVIDPTALALELVGDAVRRGLLAARS